MLKVFKCERCGATAIFDKNTHSSAMCCGAEMTLLNPGEVDAAVEKHVPVVEVEGNKVTVKVGEVEHPMMEKHWIQNIILETDKGFSFVRLTPEDKPEATFVLANGEKPVCAYEFCNLHGFWKKDI